MSIKRKAIGVTKCVMGVTHACLFFAGKALTGPYTILAKGEGQLFNTKDNVEIIRYWITEGINDIRDK